MSAGRIHSSQAPNGFAGPWRSQILKWLKERFTEKIRELKRPPTRAELALLANQTADDAAKLFQSSAPVDSGLLANSIKVQKT